MLPLIIGTIFMLSIIFLGTLWTIRGEKRMWNNGVCKVTGKPWQFFAMDSGGATGYCSEGHYIWISWINTK